MNQCSERAARPFHAIDIPVSVDPVHYFLNERDDTRSSYYLEDAGIPYDSEDWGFGGGSTRLRNSKCRDWSSTGDASRGTLTSDSTVRVGITTTSVATAAVRVMMQEGVRAGAFNKVESDIVHSALELD